MARYSSYKVLDYCFHPLRILKDGEWLVVPCNKCEGCLLHKANMWSQRLSYEIDNNPFSIFFTLTYSNKYLPTLIPLAEFDQKEVLLPDQSVIYISDHEKNIRWNGSCDVLRDDRIFISSRVCDIPITNDPRKYVVNYASKRDFQLWLKLMRKDIKEFLNINYGSESFRYFGISEKGPTTGRWHIHGLLFPKNREISEFLLQFAMYKNWKMCDSVLFYEHTKYCDSGTSTYVTNYVTSYGKLPAIYKDSAIKPFRLSSKSPAIGYASFDTQKVFEDVSSGIIEFCRSVSRIDQSFVIRYPSDYMARLFPKCYQFAQLSGSRLLFIYGYIYRSIEAKAGSYLLLSSQLRKELHPSDFEASRLCYKFCSFLGCTPFHYLYLLDLYYYKRAMSALGMWYKWQEDHHDEPLLIISSYNNLSDYVGNSNLTSSEVSACRFFFDSFGIVFDDLVYSDLRNFYSVDSGKDLYIKDVTDISSNLEKMPKFNELNGSAPHIY